MDAQSGRKMEETSLGTEAAGIIQNAQTEFEKVKALLLSSLSKP
jgi:hypothetical protein